MKLVKKHTSFEELTPTLFNTFIEKILVHEVEVDAEGQKRQKIEIVYNSLAAWNCRKKPITRKPLNCRNVRKRKSRR